MNSFSLPASQIFDWLHLSRWWSTPREQRSTTQPIVTQVELQARHLAFHRAYQRFAQQQPVWVTRRFDADFLRQVTGAGVLPSVLELAATWHRQFGPISPMPVRCQQMAELAVVAGTFLSLYQEEVRTSPPALSQSVTGGSGRQSRTG